MNQHTVAHFWAKQRVNRRGQCRAKSHSLYFKGPTIYSWGPHWPLATIHTLTDTGERVVLLHNVSHTSSTNRHRSVAWRAAHHAHLQIHCVEHDFWSDVTDRASLDRALALSKDAADQRAEDARVCRNNRARDNKEWRCKQLRSELESVIDVPMNFFDDMKDGTVLKLASLCRLSSSSRFRWCRPGPDKVFCNFLSSLFAEQPEIVRNPRQLGFILRNYQLLAA